MPPCMLRFPYKIEPNHTAILFSSAKKIKNLFEMFPKHRIKTIFHTEQPSFYDQTGQNMRGGEWSFKTMGVNLLVLFLEFHSSCNLVLLTGMCVSQTPIFTRLS